MVGSALALNLNLAIEAGLEVEDVVGRVAVDATLRLLARHPTAAHTEACVSPGVGLRLRPGPRTHTGCTSLRRDRPKRGDILTYLAERLMRKPLFGRYGKRHGRSSRVRSATWSQANQAASLRKHGGGLWRSLGQTMLLGGCWSRARAREAPWQT